MKDRLQFPPPRIKSGAGSSPPHKGRGIASRERPRTSRHATATERHPERWLALVEANGHALTEATPLTRAEQADEMLLMGLRLSEGLDLDGLARVSRLRPAAGVIAKLANLGLVSVDGAPQDGEPATTSIRATPAGRLVLNEVVTRLAAGLSPCGRPETVF